MSPAAEHATARVTAIVVAYDSADALPACLDALAAQDVPVFVVDNASQDGSAEVAERHGADVLRMGRDEGYGRANNAGVRAASSEFVLICNPDAVPDPGAVAALRMAAERYPDAGLLAPRIIEPDGRFFFQPRSLLAPYLPNPGGRLALPEGDCCAPFLGRRIFPDPTRAVSRTRRLRSRDLPVLRGRRSLPPARRSRPCTRPCA